jgi:hypothetical protein
VQDACADQANFISRQMCQARECRRPEHAGEAACVRLSEIEQSRLRGGQPWGAAGP